MNPAVTMGLLVAKKITAQRALFYWLAQMAGAILGSFFVYAVRPLRIQLIMKRLERMVGAILLKPGPSLVLHALILFL